MECKKEQTAASKMRRSIDMGKNMGKKDSKKYQKKYQRRNKVNHKAKIGIGCMVAVLVIILSVQSVRLYDKNDQYKSQKVQLQAEMEEQQQRTQDLESKKQYVESDQNTEDTAKSKLGMIKNNEIVFKEK